MTISYVGAGVLAQAATSITPAMPASPAVGQLAILQVVSATVTDSTPSAPSGWQLVDSFSGGGGTFGSGTGPRRVSWFARILTGGEAAPTTTVPTATGSMVAGQIFTLARSGGTGWRWATSLGEDTASGTGFSAPCVDTLTWAVGDFALIAYGIAAGGASLTAEAITATGITFGTVTERSDTQLTSGDLGRYGAATGSVTAGTGTQAPTVTATLAVASTGAAGVLRIRQATAALVASPQTVFPPRTLASVTGMAAEDIVTATIFRQLDSDRTPVRAASAVDVTGVDVLLRVDAEMPLGLAASYVAALTDVNGLTWEVSSGSITASADGDIISDAVNGIGAQVLIEAPWDKSRERDSTQFNVGGRLVIVSRRRSGATATVTVRTDTDQDGDALDQVLQGATEGVVMIRKQTSLSRLDGYYAVTADTERPHWYDQVRWWDLTTVQVEAWPDVLEAAGFTLQDVADNYSTLADVSAAFSTLLAIALYDFGP